MQYDKIKNQLIKHEGLQLKPYMCSAGKLTIGVGRNIEDVGISKNEAMNMIHNDISDCVADLFEIFSDFNELDDNVQFVLIDMRFQLGPKRFRTFKKMIRAIHYKDWPEMVRQMKDSAWYGQVPTRANNLIRMVEAVK